MEFFPTGYFGLDIETADLNRDGYKEVVVVLRQSSEKISTPKDFGQIRFADYAPVHQMAGKYHPISGKALQNLDPKLLISVEIRKPSRFI